MEWSNEIIFEFLSLYKTEPVLWNTKMAEHKNRSDVYAAWFRIKGKLKGGNIPVMEIRKKKNHLMATYRKLRNKIKKSMKGDGFGEYVYKPEWPFYNVMSTFLDDVYIPRSAKKFNFFAEWKSKTKTKARRNIHSLIQTGGGEYRFKGLSDLENRLLSLTGWVRRLCLLGKEKTGHPSPQEVSYVDEFVDEDNTRGSGEEEFDEPEFVVDDPLGAGADPELNPPPILPQVKKKRESKIDMGVINEAILRLDNVTAKTGGKHGLDDFEAFGRYIVASLRRMDQDSALGAQEEMRRIVQDALKGIAAQDVDDVEQRVASVPIEEDESEMSVTTVSLDPARVDYSNVMIRNDYEESPHVTVATSKPHEDTSTYEVQEHYDKGGVSYVEQSATSALPPVAKRKRLTSHSEIISHVMDKVDYMMDKVKCETDPDDFELLGRYISESLRKMPMHLALHVQNNLYSIVIKHKLESMRKHSKISNNL